MKYEIVLDCSQMVKEKIRSLGYSTGLSKKDSKIPYISHCLFITLYPGIIQKFFKKTSQLT